MQTATDPRTGKKVQWNGSAWVDLAGPAPAPAATSFGGFIPGTPKPKDPKTSYRTLTEAEAKSRGLPAGVYQESSEGKLEKVGEAAPQNDQLQAAIKGLGLDELLNGVARAREKVNTGSATGMWGAAGGLIPGSTRNDYLGNLEQIQGGIIMEKLQALKDASKTGASGMGALSEREGQRLAASVAALNGDMSAAETLRSLTDVERHVKTLQAVADGKDPRDPAVAKEYKIPPPETVGTGGDKKPGERNDRNFAVADDPNEPPPLEVIVEGGRDPTAEEARAEADRIAGREGGPGVKDIITQGMTLGLSDEAAGVGRGLAALLSGKNPVGGYRLGRDAEKLRIADARHQLGLAATPIEIASGFLSANPTAALAPLTTARQLIGQGAKQGATGGALAGFGYGEGTEGSVGGAAIGAAAGGALGGGISALSTRIGNRAVDPALADVVRAADEEGVSLIRPMVDDSSRAKFGKREAQSGSGPVIREGVNRTMGEIEAGVDRLGGAGTALDELSLGESIQTAARRDHGKLKEVRTKLYQRAQTGAMADGNPDIAPAKALAKVDEHIAQLSRLPDQNAAEITMLEGLKRDLSQPGLKLQDIRDMRTGLRKRITGDMLGTQADRRAGQVLDEARDDIAAAVSPKTANAYARADMFEAKRREYVTNTIEKFIGNSKRPVEAGKAFTRLKAMASPRGDGKRLAAFYRRLDSDEQADVAASFAKFVTGEKFTLDSLLKGTKALSPSAQETIFGPGGKRSLDNLKLLSRRLIDAQGEKNYPKSGKTAGAVMGEGFRQTLVSMAGLGAGFGTGSISTGVAAGTAALAATAVPAASRSLSARAMMSPRLTRWFAESALAKSPTQAKDAIRRLSGIAAREPAIAGEVNQLQQALSQSMLPAAASGDDEETQ